MNTSEIKTLRDLKLFQMQLKSEIKAEETRLSSLWKHAKTNTVSITIQTILTRWSGLGKWALTGTIVHQFFKQATESGLFKNGFSWKKLWTTLMDTLNRVVNFKSDSGENETEWPKQD